jgi:tetratricopeptide (TPR) repeat protein
MLLLLAAVLYQTAQEHLDRALEKGKAGDYKGAIAECDQALAQDSQNPKAFHTRGLYRHALKDFDGAISDFTKAVECDSRFSEAYNSRGLAREQKGDLDEALADFEKAIGADGLNRYPYFNRGRLFEQRKEYARAEAEYGRLIERDPKNDQGWEQRGRLRYIVNNLEAAISDYSRSLELNPKNVRSLFARGTIQEDRGNLDLALSDFNRFIELAPEDPWGYHCRGDIRLAKDDLKGALSDVDKAIDLKEDFKPSYWVRCQIRRREGHLRKALEDANRLVELDSKEAQHFVVRGRILKRLWKRDDARSDFIRAITLEPKSQWNQYHLALLEFDNRKWPEAAKALVALKTMDPPSSDYVQIRLWVARAEMGDRREATADLLGYLKTRPATEWPVQIGSFLAGTSNEEAFFGAARSGDPKKLEGRLLEARYYAAMKRLLDGEKVKAAEYLKRCLASSERTYFEHDSAIFELEALEPGARGQMFGETAEDVFDQIEERVHLAKSVTIKFTYETRKQNEKKPFIEASGTILVRHDNKVFAVERFIHDGEVIEKKQISDGIQNAFWVGERRETKKTLKNETVKALNGILRLGYIQSQLFKINLIPLDPHSDPDLGDFDPKPFIRLEKFNFGEEEAGAKTIMYRYKDEPNILFKIWYDPKTLTLLKRTMQFPGADGGISIEKYSEFALDAALPDERFTIPEEKK